MRRALRWLSRWLMGRCTRCGEVQIQSEVMGNWCGCNDRAALAAADAGEVDRG